MKKLLITTLLIFTLTGCNNFQSAVKRGESECDSDKSIITASEKFDCYTQKERPQILAHYPAVIPVFDNFVDRRRDIALKFDGGDISESKMNQEIGKAKVPVINAIQNYQAFVIEAKKQQYCANMGAPIGSDKYYSCRQWIEQELANERAQANQAVISSALQQQQQEAIQQQLQQQQQQNYYNSLNNRILQSAPTNCITTPMGNTLHTTCQ